MAAPSIARAQDIEPRAYSNAPIGVNFVIAGLVHTRGGLAFDASLPITDAQHRTTGAVFAYARVHRLRRQFRQVRRDRAVRGLSGDANYLGQPVSRDVNGFGRPAFRVSINLHGAPALSLREFSDWKQDLIVGASLQVSPPWSQYDGTGWSTSARIAGPSNRRSGSRRPGPMDARRPGRAVFFTDNDDFFGGNTRSQGPLYSLQAHAIYGFASGNWLPRRHCSPAAFRNRRRARNDLQQNWRLGRRSRCR